MIKSTKLLRLCSSNLITKRHLSGEEKPRSAILKHLPLIGVLVGVSAFSFQVGILFPWHEELSNQFKELEAVTNRNEKVTAALHENLTELKTLVELVKIKERKVLDKEEEILAKLEHMSKKENE